MKQCSKCLRIWRRGWGAFCSLAAQIWITELFCLAHIILLEIVVGLLLNTDKLFMSISYQMQVPVPDTQWGQTIPKRWRLEQRKVYWRENGWFMPRPILNSPKGFGKIFLKASWGRGVAGCCRLLGVGILCSCSCPRRPGRKVPVNLQQDKCYSLFCNFSSLSVNGKVLYS